jgi:branched-chain amino acid transport system permease protein
VLNPVASRSLFPLSLAIAAALPFVFKSDYFASIAVLFGLYAAINYAWTLVLATAGIFSFATIAIVGVSAYVAALVGGATTTLQSGSGAPMWLILVVATAVGIACGVVIAAPAIRLRGVYFGLFTFGLVQVCASYFVQSSTFGYATGLSGARSFVSDANYGTEKGRLIQYFVAAGICLVAFLVYWVADHGRLGILLRTARESEQFAAAVGISTVRVRFAAFVISSGLLGLIGGVYIGIYGAVSPQIFSFETLLLLFAMIIVGGLGSSPGVLLGALAIITVQERLNNLGALRFVLIGALMLVVVVFARGGLVGIAGQLWLRGRRGVGALLRVEQSRA